MAVAAAELEAVTVAVAAAVTELIPRLGAWQLPAVKYQAEFKLAAAAG